MDFVRIDFYDTPEKLFFGELTATPGLQPGALGAGSRSTARWARTGPSAGLQVVEAAIRLKPQEAALEAVYRKVAWRLIPFLVLCFFCAYIDRINVGFAKLQMLRDLGFSDAVFGAGAGIFFLSYALLEIPSNLILARDRRAPLDRAHHGDAGAASPPSAMFVRTPRGVLRDSDCCSASPRQASRPASCSMFRNGFPARHRGSAMAAFFMAIPLSGMIGAPLSGWLLGTLQGALAGLSGWQWLFLVEALPSAVLVGLRLPGRAARHGHAMPPWLDARRAGRLLEQRSSQPTPALAVRPCRPRRLPVATGASGRCRRCISASSWASTRSPSGSPPSSARPASTVSG